MLDPDEGVGPDGEIVTGARRDRVPPAFEPVLAAAVGAVGDASLHLYGSVATGRAKLGGSDVDLVGVGLPGAAAARISAELSCRFERVCRAVEIGPGRPGDVVGDSDEAYGNRVFLRHYCVQLSGPPRTDLAHAYPADARAACGFNGDIAAHAGVWGRALDDGADPAPVARRLARKTPLAVAGLVSVLDRTWTTDRTRAARRWAELRPHTAADMATLLEWSEACGRPDRPGVRQQLAGTVAEIVEAFAGSVGLWRPAT